jgi:hypothetical protein
MTLPKITVESAIKEMKDFLLLNVPVPQKEIILRKITKLLTVHEKEITKKL